MEIVTIKPVVVDGRTIDPNERIKVPDDIAAALVEAGDAQPAPVQLQVHDTVQVMGCNS
jgi:hypothetical protein